MNRSDTGALEPVRNAPAVPTAYSSEKHSGQIVEVSIAALIPGESPRLNGHDQEHVARLAEIDTPLPPILVDRRTMRVIDGMHRVFAAVLQGRREIEVEFFDGESEDAFLKAVEANVAHGFPLSQADRRAAAARIMITHPLMSDRAIAKSAGLGAKTVAAIRRSTEAVPQLDRRIGRDGKVRPLSSAAGRHRVAEVLAKHPTASLREVARLAGVSPATAGDVRHRLARGEDPVPGNPHVTETKTVATATATRMVKRKTPQDPASLLETLLRDPALRNNEEGRNLLRLLCNNALGTQQWIDLVAAVPPHCGGLVLELARRYAELWTDFSAELHERVRSAADDLVSTGDAASG